MHRTATSRGRRELRLGIVDFWDINLSNYYRPYNKIAAIIFISFYMSRAYRNFMVEVRNFEIMIFGNNAVIKVVIIDGDSLNIGQQMFSDGSLGQLIGSSAFKNISEFHAFLNACSSTPERWFAQDTDSLQINSEVKFALKPVVDPLQLSKIALIRASFKGSSGKTVENGNLQQEVAALKVGYNALGPKLKKIGEVVQELHQATTQNTKRIALQDDKLKQVEAMVREYGKRAEQSIENIKLSIDIIEKTMHRNNQTLNQTQETSQKQLKEQISKIWSQILKYDLMRIRRENEQILLQVKVKPLSFIPDPSLLQVNRKLHWINKKILRNLEDVKDYNKSVTEQPLAPGISKMRIIIHSLKSNGLIFGVCGRKVKEAIQSTAFNDPNMICLNSCGYVINRGAMIPSTAKIKAGDILKMQVNLNQGIITWFCNDVQVAVADMCPLNKDQVFVVIGLGFFGDEVEVCLTEPPPKAIVEVVRDTYAKELQRMNEKFGSNSRKRY